MVLCFALAGRSAAGMQEPAIPQPDPIPGMVNEVSPERIGERIQKLVDFHTRNTLSQTDSLTAGIGAARQWIERDLKGSALASRGKLDVRTQSTSVMLGPKGAEHEVEVVNVYGFLPGRQDAPNGRTYVVSGHYDSMASDRWDTESAAPGADDDASGTAVVLELARVMSTQEYEANLVFLCVAGEEQGLHGSTAFATWAASSGLAIDGMLTNDIVGGTVGGSGASDDAVLRCYSGEGALDSPSRELARSLQSAVERYLYDFTIRQVFRADRIGRGGDHLPFLERGFPAVRLTEPHEDYHHQHQDVRTADGVQYGDLVDFVSFDYVARVARANLAVLAELASAPAPPPSVRLRAALRYDTEVSWEASPSANVAGYQIVWRETTAPCWEHRSELVKGLTFVLSGVTADVCFVGVRALDAQGHGSRATLPVTPTRGR
jgi:hypothetical protein